MTNGTIITNSNAAIGPIGREQAERLGPIGLVSLGYTRAAIENVTTILDNIEQDPSGEWVVACGEAQALLLALRRAEATRAWDDPILDLLEMVAEGHDGVLPGSQLPWGALDRLSAAAEAFSTFLYTGEVTANDLVFGGGVVWAGAEIPEEAAEFLDVDNFAGEEENTDFASEAVCGDPDCVCAMFGREIL